MQMMTRRGAKRRKCPKIILSFTTYYRQLECDFKLNGWFLSECTLSSFEEWFFMNQDPFSLSLIAPFSSLFLSYLLWCYASHYMTAGVWKPVYLIYDDGFNEKNLFLMHLTLQHHTHKKSWKESEFSSPNAQLDGKCSPSSYLLSIITLCVMLYAVCMHLFVWIRDEERDFDSKILWRQMICYLFFLKEGLMWMNERVGITHCSPYVVTTFHSSHSSWTGSSITEWIMRLGTGFLRSNISSSSLFWRSSCNGFIIPLFSSFLPSRMPFPFIISTLITHPTHDIRRTCISF